jgi:diacylglycerol kinase
MLSEHHPKLHYYSLQNAWRGFYRALLTQRNLRVEVLIGIVALFAGYLLQFTSAQLMIVLALIFLVLSFEMINTSVEAMVDSVHVEQSELAKVSKDAAAGAVLLITILAAIVGVYLYLLPILTFFY